MHQQNKKQTNSTSKRNSKFRLNFFETKFQLKILPSSPKTQTLTQYRLEKKTIRKAHKLKHTHRQSIIARY